MNNKALLSAVVIVSLFLTFYAIARKSADESAEPEEIIFDDRRVAGSTDEVVFDDKDFGRRIENPPSPVEVQPETTKIAADGSQINTMFDRYGNKTEKRSFNSHSRLTFVLLRTDMEGKREALVYGQSGEVKSLPENMLDKALTVTADEIANSAGIQYIKRENSMPVQNAAPPAPVRQTPTIYQNRQEEIRTNENEQKQQQPKAEPPADDLQSKQLLLQNEVNRADLVRTNKKTKAAGNGD